MAAFTNEGLDHIDALVARAVDEQQAPGVVVGVARDDVVHVATAGLMALDGGPMRRDTLFRLASITKPMTAAVVLSLVDAGALALDDPVERWLPELADRQVLRHPGAALDDTVPAHRAVTVRDLLTFTWGFGMQGAMFVAPEPWPVYTAAVERELHTFGAPHPAAMPDPDAWMAALGELPLLLQPGEKWLYQSGSQVLGVLVSRVLDVPFDEAMQLRLLTPLGMRDTGFHTVENHRLATAYARRGGQLEIDDPPDGEWSAPPAFADGGAGLVSSVDDVIAFGRMLLRGGEGVLESRTVDEMTRDQLTAGQRRNDWPGFDILDGEGWGYGVAVTDDGRYFWDGGIGTAWSNVPALDLTVVVLTQRMWDETGPPAVCAGVLQAAAEAARAAAS